jgi:hypothetical protein
LKKNFIFDSIWNVVQEARLEQERLQLRQNQSVNYSTSMDVASDANPRAEISKVNTQHASTQSEPIFETAMIADLRAQLQGLQRDRDYYQVYQNLMNCSAVIFVNVY